MLLHPAVPPNVVPPTRATHSCHPLLLLLPDKKLQICWFCCCAAAAAIPLLPMLFSPPLVGAAGALHTAVDQCHHLVSELLPLLAPLATWVPDGIAGDVYLVLSTWVGAWLVKQGIRLSAASTRQKRAAHSLITQALPFALAVTSGAAHPGEPTFVVYRRLRSLPNHLGRRRVVGWLRLGRCWSRPIAARMLLPPHAPPCLILLVSASDKLPHSCCKSWTQS